VNANFSLRFLKSPCCGKAHKIENECAVHFWKCLTVTILMNRGLNWALEGFFQGAVGAGNKPRASASGHSGGFWGPGLFPLDGISTLLLLTNHRVPVRG
jgi:hypothetical protein